MAVDALREIRRSPGPPLRGGDLGLGRGLGPFAMVGASVMARLSTQLQRALAALAVGLFACDSAPQAGPHPLRIERVQQRLGSGGVIDEARLVPAVSSAIGEHAGLRIASPGHRGPALGAEIWFQEQVAEDGAREVYLQAQLEVPNQLRPVLGGLIHATVILEREGADEALLDDDVATATARAFAVLDTRLALARGDHEVVRGLLEVGDAELVILALEWIRENTPAEFADDVVGLLAHKDERVTALAVECLGYAADPSMVGPIIRHARPMSRTQTREVYRALARLRGPEALGYLRFAAANEDDSLLQGEAERSLRLALTGIPAEPSMSQHDPSDRLARGHRQ